MQTIKALAVLSDNTKTGKLATLYIGRNKTQAKKACQGCPLLESKKCYAWQGTPAKFGLAAIERALKEKRKSLADYKLENILPRANANVVRFGAIGNPSALGKTEFNRLYALSKNAGKNVISYDHNWRNNLWLKGKSMASCDTWKNAKLAVSLGFRAALHVNPRTFEKMPRQGKVNGIPYTLCPAQRNENITCTKCQLCVAEKIAAPIILFAEHGNKTMPHITRRLRWVKAFRDVLNPIGYIKSLYTGNGLKASDY